MDRDRQHIEEDLKGLLAGEVRCDPVCRRLYASDASLFSIEPLGIVRPKHVDDCVALVQYAAENAIPLHPRGAGTGLTGGAIGPGLVVDFSRTMNRVRHVDETTVRVQAGCGLRELNTRLSQTKRTFGPDPAKWNTTTVGGVVAVNASGSHWGHVGAARDHIESLEIVLADGTFLEVGRHEVQASGEVVGPLQLATLVQTIVPLLQKHAKQIAKHSPQSCVNTSGYLVQEVLSESRNGTTLDLPKLLAGSEGTLAMMTGMTLRHVPLQKQKKVALLIFASMEKATQCVQAVRELKPSACDLMDRRHISMARDTDIRFELMLPIAAEAVLLVEFIGDLEEHATEKMQSAIQLAERELKLAASHYLAADEQDIALCWKLAQSFAPSLSRMKGRTRPVPFMEDIAIPPQHLGDFLSSLQDTLRRHEVTASLFSHAGHGQVHIRPFLDISRPEERQRLVHLAEDVYEQVWLVEGTVSGEHGDGLSRTPFLEKQFGPLCALFRDIKKAFDPENIFNPGIIVPIEGDYSEDLLFRFHRRSSIDVLQRRSEVLEANENDVVAEARLMPIEEATKEPPVDLLELQAGWSEQTFAESVDACNFCGVCRTQSPGVRMCPIFRFAPSEEASPRAKANLLGFLSQKSDALEIVASDAFKAVADLCIHCHACRLECPIEVDIPRLVIEAKAAHVREQGISAGESWLSRIDQLCSIGSRFRWLANWSLKSNTMRYLFEKMLGLSRGRTLPSFAKRTFLRQGQRRGLTKPARDQSTHKVALFLDTYANFFDVALAEAFVAILEHNGVSVFIPKNQLGSAMPLIAQGLLDKAKPIARNNIETLAEAVRLGYTIVSTEPTAILALTREYQQFFPGDDDALLVAKASREACHYLWQLHQQGGLKLDFQQLEATIGYHVPCHTRALEIGTPAEHLLRLVPGLRIKRFEKGCSGMAGMYGLAQKNYRNSLQAGRPLIKAIRESAIDFCATECSACKMQMEHRVTTKTHHPIIILARAYGLEGAKSDLYSNKSKKE